MNAMPNPQPLPAPRKSNRRTALVMASVAAMFFIGIVIRHWLFGN